MSRELAANSLAYVQSRREIEARFLYWFTARNRTSGLPETIGLWDGDDDETFNIGGDRLYYGAGTILSTDRLTFRAGAVVQMQVVTLALQAPPVLQLVFGYDPRGAKVEVRCALFDTLTHQLEDVPFVIFDGNVERAPAEVPPVNTGGSTVQIEMASAARVLTRTLPQKWSDAVLRRRSGDRIAKYAGVSGDVPTVWG